MVQLTDKDSFPFVEECADRHMRLCTQVPGGDKYSAKLKAPYDDLVVKLGLRKTAKKNVSGAIDTVTLYADAVNNSIRKVQGRAKEFDKANLGANTTEFILPEGNITPIIKLNAEEKTEKAHEVALKIIALGKDHVLYPLAAELDTAIDVLNEKALARTNTEKAYSAANTDAYVAKVALVNQYNANYFDAAHDVNKEYAEKLFPHLSPPEDDEKENNNGTPK